MRSIALLALLLLAACQSAPSYTEYGAAPQVVDDHTPVGCASWCPDRQLQKAVSFDLQIGPGKQLSIDGEPVTVSEFLVYARYWRKLVNVTVNISTGESFDRDRLWAAYFATLSAQNDVGQHVYRASKGANGIQPEFSIKLAPGLEKVVAEAPIVVGPFEPDSTWYDCKFRMYGELYDPGRAERDARETYESGVPTLIEVHIGLGGYGFVGLTPGWRAPDGVAVVSEMLDTGGDAISDYCTGKYLDGRHRVYASRFNRVMSELIDGTSVPTPVVAESGGIDFQSYYENFLPDVYQAHQGEPSVLIAPVLWQKERADGPMLYRISREAEGIQVSQWSSRYPVFGRKVDLPGCAEGAVESAVYLHSCRPFLMGVGVRNSSQEIDTHWVAKTIQHYACGPDFTSRGWVRKATAGVTTASTPSYAFAADCDEGWQVNLLPGLAAIRIADAGDTKLQRLLALYHEIESQEDVQAWNPVHPEAAE